MTARVTSRKGVLSCSVARTEEGRAFVVCGGWANGNGWRNTNHRPSSAKHTPLSLSRLLNEGNKRFGRITVQELLRRRVSRDGEPETCLITLVTLKNM